MGCPLRVFLNGIKVTTTYMQELLKSYESTDSVQTLLGSPCVCFKEFAATSWLVCWPCQVREASDNREEFEVAKAGSAPGRTPCKERMRTQRLIGRPRKLHMVCMPHWCMCGAKNATETTKDMVSAQQKANRDPELNKWPTIEEQNENAQMRKMYKAMIPQSVKRHKH